MRIRPSLLAAAVAAAGLIGPAAAGGSTDGKEVFLAAKCNLCHAVSGAGIEATSTNEKLRGPDLSAVAPGDAAFLAGYLRQEETVDGKKHKKKFTGSDEELDALIRWLREQAAEGEGGDG